MICYLLLVALCVLSTKAKLNCGTPIISWTRPNQFPTEPNSFHLTRFMEDAIGSITDSISYTPGSRALEIGGPTQWMNMYGSLENKLDNVIQDSSDGYEKRGGVLPSSASSTATTTPYTIDGVLFGTTFFLDGADLSTIESNSYDLVISSHNLEHFVDPLSALTEWDRVLSPDGHMLVIVPWKENTFDRFREPSTFEQILADHCKMGRNKEKLNEVIESKYEIMAGATDYTMMGRDSEEAEKSFREMRNHSNPFWTDKYHWSVFTFETLADMFGSVGYEIVTSDLLKPYHMVVFAKKKKIT